MFYQDNLNEAINLLNQVIQEKKTFQRVKSLHVSIRRNGDIYAKTSTETVAFIEANPKKELVNEGRY